MHSLISFNYCKVIIAKNEVFKNHVDEIISLFEKFSEVSKVKYSGEIPCALGVSVQYDFKSWLQNDSTEDYEIVFNYEIKSYKAGEYSNISEYFNEKIEEKLNIFLKGLEKITSIFYRDILTIKDFEGKYTRKMSKKDLNQYLDLKALSSRSSKIVKAKIFDKSKIYNMVFGSNDKVILSDQSNMALIQQKHPSLIDLTYAVPKSEVKTAAFISMAYLTQFIDSERHFSNFGKMHFGTDSYFESYFNYNQANLNNPAQVIIEDENMSEYIKAGKVFDIEDQDYIFSLANDSNQSILVREAALSLVPLHRIQEIYDKDDKIKFFIGILLKNLPQSLSFMADLRF